MNDPIGSNGTGCWRMGCDHITLSVDVGFNLSHGCNIVHTTMVNSSNIYTYTIAMLPKIMQCMG